MTTPFGSPTSARREQPLLVCALVAALVVVGYLAYFRVMTWHLVPRLYGHWPQSQLGLLRFLVETSPFVLLGAVLLAWGNTRRGRLAGASCAVLAGLVDWGLMEAAQKLYERDLLTTTRIKALDWALTLVVPTLVALAWGLARRSGRAWIAGVLVAPLLAGIHRHLQLHSAGFSSWETGRQQWWFGRLELIAPIIAACLVCWLIELGWPASRSSDAGMTQPEMQSSA